MSRIFWTEAAEDSRNAAIEYIAQSNLAAALNQFDEIEKQTDRLLKHPHLGRASRVQGARELSINRTNFVVVYRIVGDNIQVFRFRHTSQKR